MTDVPTYCWRCKGKGFMAVPDATGECIDYVPCTVCGVDHDD